MNPEKLKEKASPKGDKKAELAAALQKKKRRQKKRKHQIRAFLLMNKTGLIALLGISVVAGSYFTFEFFRPAPEEPGNQIVVSEETKKQDEEVDKFFVLFKGGVLRNKAARIEQLKQAVGLAEEIEANEFTSEKARNEVRLSKIDAAAELTIRAFESGMEEAHEFETNLEKMVSKELSNGGNGPAQQVAHLNITIYYILRHGSELSEKTCQRAIQQSQTSIPELVKSNTDLQRILKAGRSLGKNIQTKNDPTWELLFELGQVMRSTATPRNQILGSHLHDELLIQGRDITLACKRAEAGDRQALLELASFIDDVLNHNYPSERLYNEVYHALDIFGRQPSIVDQESEIDLTAISNRAKQAISEIENNDLRAKILLLQNQFEERTFGLIGKQIDLADLPDKIRNQLRGKPVIIYFTSLSEEAMNFARGVASFRSSSPHRKNEEFIYVCLPQPAFLTGLETKFNYAGESTRLTMQSPGTTHVVFDESAKNILAQFPITQAPYGVALNANHQVVRSNFMLSKWGSIFDE